MPIIDLALLEPRIASRAQYFEQCAQGLVAARIFSPADVRLRAPAPRFVAEAYFLLSEAYKDRRLKDGALTEEPKIAAFMSVAIMAVWPFQAINPMRVKRPDTVIANGIFAVFCASSVINNDFSGLTWDMKRRLYNFLQSVRLPCLQPYITDISIGASRSSDTYDVTLSDAEIALIDVLVLIYELLYRPSPATP